MQKWTVIDPPDRWDVASAVIEADDIRRTLEFFGRRRGSVGLVPLHVIADTLTHIAGQPLTVHGYLTHVRDHPRADRPRVAVRLWPHLRRGELRVLGP